MGVCTETGSSQKRGPFEELPILPKKSQGNRKVQLSDYYEILRTEKTLKVGRWGTKLLKAHHLKPREL